MLETGDPAPEVSLPRDGGETVALADFAGRPVVLYFYPRDDTPGCTKEAIGFTDRAGNFAAAGATVLGVSKDTVAKHEKFRDKYGLGVTLLSDADGDVAERYGVWVEKTMYGRTSMGIERATFLIAPDGTIARIWRKVKVDGHVDEVLAAVQEL
ncbi:thioredoxin-dependent thiol peroxidase [Mesobaculum littorinae]|uniref:thioredoxin-dependent peroxiredoxin n=1 Tax=Mesobaculum littorinae TaxID=2486419 RepID=A0A438AKU0_9RHOB|nr:thioredoxin-dependent thiol peroxidase [Mesobaculum littorinae]RVV99441.1 thioredoxin-dependent thiol peroxidase [Mesobaculum littorinae]